MLAPSSWNDVLVDHRTGQQMGAWSGVVDARRIIVVDAEGIISKVPLHLSELPPQVLHDSRKMRIASPADTLRTVRGVRHALSFLSSA